MNINGSIVIAAVAAVAFSACQSQPVTHPVPVAPAPIMLPAPVPAPVVKKPVSKPKPKVKPAPKEEDFVPMLRLRPTEVGGRN